ncbi:MAG: hypothetical protein JSS66_17375 [Armatimonadetes bacterium]|nr:hypothetical protein [Armatimonadota bacterium]
MNRTFALAGSACAAALGVLMISARSASSQVQGQQPGYVKLQTATPGTAQVGNQNVTGTGIFGVVKMNAFVLPTGAISGRVLGCDNNGDGFWQVDGLSLPFNKIVNLAGGLMSLTNQSGSGITVQAGGTALTGILGGATALSSSFGSSGVVGDSIAGNGVVGASSAAGLYGVVGVANGSQSCGIAGYNADTTGSLAYGVWGQASGDHSVGILGLSTSTSGPTIGISAVANSVSGIAIRASESGATGNTIGVFSQVQSGTGTAIWGNAAAQSGANIGLKGWAQGTNGMAVLGQALASTGTTYGGRFEASSPTGYALYAINNATGAYAYLGGPTYTIYAEGASSRTIFGNNTATTGAAYGVYGQTVSTTGRGVYGNANAGTGINYGVFGDTDSPTGYGVYGSGPAGSFGVYASGNLGASGTKSFRIDHPLDPRNKYLLHYCAEGPEPQNIYNGVVKTDAKGYAWVDLPSYFASINKDCRYQLTVLDDSEDFVLAKVTRGVQGNRFQIRTNKGGVKVSWEVKATRNDLWVQEHGAPVEVEKQGTERGTYQHPELYNKQSKSP